MEIQNLSLLLGVMSVSLSVFTFGICLYVARRAGQHYQRDVLFGAINKKFCDIRQIHLDKRYEMSPRDNENFNRCCKDANDVFLEVLKTPSTDLVKLKEANAGLDAIIGRMLTLSGTARYRIIMGNN